MQTKNANYGNTRNRGVENPISEDMAGSVDTRSPWGHTAALPRRGGPQGQDIIGSCDGIAAGGPGDYSGGTQSDDPMQSGHNSYVKGPGSKLGPDRVDGDETGYSGENAA